VSATSYCSLCQSGDDREADPIERCLNVGQESKDNILVVPWARTVN
jgi:hypothetical protein